MKKLIAAAVLGLSVLMFSGCSTVGFMVEQNNQKNKVEKNYKHTSKKYWGSPENSALVFGPSESYGYLNETLFIQQNPEIGYMFYQIHTGGYNMFTGYAYYLEPLQINSEMHLVRDHFMTKRLIINYGLGGVDFVIKEPGLYYYDFRGDFKGDNLELKSLKLIKEDFKDTDWYEVIEKRIEELENE